MECKSLDETKDQLRYGLMELGGFMRDHALTAAQRCHRFYSGTCQLCFVADETKEPRHH